MRSESLGSLVSILCIPADSVTVKPTATTVVFWEEFTSLLCRIRWPIHCDWEVIETENFRRQYHSMVTN